MQERLVSQRSLLQVFVQREDLLPDIIETLSMAIPGHIAITEASNARCYLHRLPLFSGFWTETENPNIKIVTAVVETAKCNDLTRRIMLLTGDEDAPGVLVCAQDLRFAMGQLEL